MFLERLIQAKAFSRRKLYSKLVEIPFCKVMITGDNVEAASTKAAYNHIKRCGIQNIQFNHLFYIF